MARTLLRGGSLLVSALLAAACAGPVATTTIPTSTTTTTVVAAGSGAESSTTSVPSLGARFEATAPLEGWEGEVTVWMRTCDGSTWEGALTLEGTLEGGLAHLVGEAPLAVTIRPGETVGTAPVTYRYELEMVVEDARGTSTAEAPGTVSLEIVDSTAHLEVTMEATTQTVTVVAPDFSVTMTAPVAAGRATFSAALQPDPGCG